MQQIENIYTIDELISLQNIIEKMEKTNQVKVLRLLKQHNDITINVNKNGIHINLSELNKSVIDELFGFIDYVNKQELMLGSDEHTKEEYKETFYS
jgi:hypothetical protein